LSFTLTTAWDDTVVIVYIAVIAEVASRAGAEVALNLADWLKTVAGFINHAGALSFRMCSNLLAGHESPGYVDGVSRNRMSADT
jgi:hypothetical protein